MNPDVENQIKTLETERAAALDTILKNGDDFQERMTCAKKYDDQIAALKATV